VHLARPVSALAPRHVEHPRRQLAQGRDIAGAGRVGVVQPLQHAATVEALAAECRQPVPGTGDGARAARDSVGVATWEEAEVGATAAAAAARSATASALAIQTVDMGSARGGEWRRRRRRRRVPCHMIWHLARSQ
jgi:hypothetical protein